MYGREGYSIPEVRIGDRLACPPIGIVLLPIPPAGLAFTLFYCRFCAGIDPLNDLFPPAPACLAKYNSYLVIGRPDCPSAPCSSAAFFRIF